MSVARAGRGRGTDSAHPAATRGFARDEQGDERWTWFTDRPVEWHEPATVALTRALLGS